MVSFRVVIEAHGLQDIQNSIDYYETQQAGLGERFFNVIQKHFEIISSNPFHRIKYKDYRVLPVKIFPFIIVYYIVKKTNTVYIASVFHTSQNPDKLPV